MLLSKNFEQIGVYSTTVGGLYSVKLIVSGNQCVETQSHEYNSIFRDFLSNLFFAQKSSFRCQVQNWYRCHKKIQENKNTKLHTPGWSGVPTTIAAKSNCIWIEKSSNWVDFSAGFHVDQTQGPRPTEKFKKGNTIYIKMVSRKGFQKNRKVSKIIFCTMQNCIIHKGAQYADCLKVPGDTVCPNMPSGAAHTNAEVRLDGAPKSWIYRFLFKVVPIVFVYEIVSVPTMFLQFTNMDSNRPLWSKKKWGGFTNWHTCDNTQGSSTIWHRITSYIHTNATARDDGGIITAEHCPGGTWNIDCSTPIGALGSTGNCSTPANYLNRNETPIFGSIFFW